MVLEIEPEGPPRLGVITVDQDGKPHEAYSARLE
jgi:hypothetical protein